MTMIRDDGYYSLITGIGTARDPAASIRYFEEPLLSQPQLESIFSSGLARRIIEMPADDMVREWFDVHSDEGEGVLDYLETFGAKESFADAVVWARLHGGAAVLPILDEGVDFSVPLNFANVKKILGLRVYDRWAISWERTIDKLSKDPVKRLKYLPEFFNIQPATAQERFVCHESRLILIPGKRLPERQMLFNQGWGASVLQTVYMSLARHDTGLGYANSILRDFVQAVLSVKDLSTMFAAGNDAIVEKRIKLLELSRSILNTMVIDANGEEYTKSASSVQGIPDVLDRFAEHICACTGIPMAKLFGRSAAGLNSTGQHDETSYYDTIASEQERMLNPLAEFIVKLAFNSKEGPTNGVEPETWSVVWNSLKQPTDKEVADLRKVVADTDAVYITNGVLSPQEVAKSRFGQDEWSMDTQLENDTTRKEVASENPEDVAARELETAKATAIPPPNDKGNQ